MSVRVLPAVQVDEVRGHIRCGELVLCDLGPILNVWSYCGVDLTPETAHDLGNALIAWAGRKT